MNHFEALKLLHLYENQYHKLLAKRKKKRVVVFDLVNREISEVFNIPVQNILSKNQEQDIVFARYVAFYIHRHMFKMTYKKIAMAYNKKCHTTILNAMDNIEIITSHDWVFTHNLCQCWDQIKNQINE